jgi:hypothetical protein
MKKLLWITLLIFALALSISLACGDDDDDDDDDTVADDDDDNDDNDDTTADDDDDDVTPGDDDDDDVTPGDDDDDTTPADDDDDTTPADDDDDDDVTPGDYTCAEVGDGFFNTCGQTLQDGDGVAQDEAGLVAWCGLSEALYAGKTVSEFWNCLGFCAVDDGCDTACFNACLEPADPGTGCGHTVDGIYECGVIFLFEGSRKWIPEMDMHATCDLFEDDWTCYQTCVDSQCTGGPFQSTNLINCLNANCS